MNLNDHPTTQQLRELIAPCDDRAGNHVVWVTRAGEVHITCLPRKGSASLLEAEHPEMQLRYETFLSGNEYVGPEAAADEEWLVNFFDSLSTEWPKAKGQKEVTYVPLSLIPEPAAAKSEGPRRADHDHV